ncbi:MAG: HAMP domain-containing protein, partial [Phycisphaerales bacterium]
MRTLGDDFGKPPDLIRIEGSPAGGAGRSTRAVTELAEQVGRLRGDDDLGERLAVGGDLEVRRLAAAFNGLLARLESAREARARFTADASHELRTPLTSLR